MFCNNLVWEKQASTTVCIVQDCPNPIIGVVYYSQGAWAKTSPCLDITCFWTSPHECSDRGGFSKTNT
eukprot:9104626-Heterocapsa_arctica.AAC.1